MKKFLSLLLCVALFFTFAACGDKSANNPTVNISDESVAVEQAPVVDEPKFAVNPLTGLEELDFGKENLRPVAIMINNIRVAQSVQTGVTKADIVYEMEVEGGITRLMAVFKDISKAGQLGSVRSARYDYIDLALGHDAIYVHGGIDMTYAYPHVSETGVSNFNIDSYPWAPYGFRESNGLASEHTLYTTSEKLNQGFKDLQVRTTTEKSNTFCEFNETATVPAEGTANKVSVNFSNVATSIFEYNAETKTYTKNTAVNNNKDYKTGESYVVTNVIVLQTRVGNFADNKHKDIDLVSGSGYYFSNGGYQKILWKKGGAKDTITYYNTDNTPLKINPGKTWICIQSNTKSVGIE